MGDANGAHARKGMLFTGMKRNVFAGVTLFALAMLSACTPLARVRGTRPLAPSPGSGAQLRHAEQLMAAGEKLRRKDPLAAMECYLDAVNSAEEALRGNPGDSGALRDSNYALSRMFGVMSSQHIAAWSRPLQLPREGGGYVLSCRKGSPTWWNPADYDFIPADQLSIGGSAFSRRVQTPGLGVPLVAVNNGGLADYRDRFVLSKKVYYSVTAVARFNGKQCVISFEDPYGPGTVVVDGRSFPLAADYSAALAMTFAGDRWDLLGLAHLFLPERYASSEHISLLQPYDPEKTPVLFVHGLQDTPATWAFMINTLRADPALRRRYQFWVFGYPSGYPFPYSAMLLRADLDKVRAAFPGTPRMVMVGHSMGGLICRLMVTDSGNKFWSAYFKKPPGELRLPPAEKAILTGALIFNHRPEVSRVIFISTPHRGSIIASNWIGRLVSGIVWAPQNLVALARDALQFVVQENGSGIKLNHVPNSIDTLSPNNRFLKVMNTLPITQGASYYSIMGDRGRGDTLHSSDGVVTYSSSHIDGAASECIVPSGHDVQKNPRGVAEVSRILKLRIHGALSTP